MKRVENQKAKNIKKIKRSLFYIILFVSSLVFIYPLIYTVISSLKNNADIYANYFGLPEIYRFTNYLEALRVGKLGRAFMNSALLTIITVSVQLLFSSMAAFAITRIKFKMSSFTLLFFSVGMMIPMQAILIPIATLAQRFGISNSYVGLLAVYIAGGIPYVVFIVSGYMRSLPKELEEAAIIDGANIWQIFWRIDLVLSKPIIVTMGIIAFLGTWNELSVALVLIKDAALQTLPIRLLSFTGQFTVDWGVLCAAIVIAIIPTIIVYIIFQDNVERGLAEGGVKG